MGSRLDRCRHRTQCTVLFCIDIRLEREDFASTHFFRQHFEACKLGRPKHCRDRDVGRVAAAGDDNSADAGMVVARVERVPLPPI